MPEISLFYGIRVTMYYNDHIPPIELIRLSKGENHMNEYFPTVVQVIPLDNFHVQVFFENLLII